MRKTIFLLLTISLLVNGVLYAGVPHLINYRGNLVQSGTAVTGTRSINFQIYDALTGGTLLWESTAKNINVYNGAFAYTLGIDNATTFSNIDWKNKTCYIQVVVQGNALSPRERIGSVGYSLVSQEAMFVSSSNVDLGGGHKLSEWVSTNGKINGNSVEGTWVKIDEKKGCDFFNFTNLRPDKHYKIMYWIYNVLINSPIKITINNDSGANYQWNSLYTFGTNIQYHNEKNTSEIKISPLDSDDMGNVDGYFEIYSSTYLYGVYLYGITYSIGMNSLCMYGGCYKGQMFIESVQIKSGCCLYAVLLELR